MELENEKKAEGYSVEQNGGGREGYRPTNQSEGNQGYRAPGRSPRPRFRPEQPYNGGNRQAYNNHANEGAFRPEGFGAGLQSDDQQQRQYRPRYNAESGAYRPRQNGEGNEGGYRPNNAGYNNRQGAYRPNNGGYNNRQGGYRPHYNGGEANAEGGYNTYNANRQAGYQQRDNNNYQQRQSGYRPNAGYNNNRGGYGNNRQSGYNNNRQGYNNNRQGGFRQRTAGYDPNAKYSLKKRITYKEEHFDPNEPVRLNKFLANAGVCSRREADEFITAGVITVNGVVVTELGTKVMRTDEIKFHDQSVTPEKKVYVLLNKPKDYVTTSDDPQQRKIVMDLVKGACTERIYPVGRLDRNTTGVLLLTNDGDLASKLTHPKFLKKKIYHVYLDKNVTAHDMQQIREGITLEDGEVKVDAVEYADVTDKKQVGVEIHSGKNRIVRRIFENFGYKVTKLDRVQFAGLTKKNLRRGDWRYLTEEEVDRLRMGAYE